jgi:hypothetical protein
MRSRDDSLVSILNDTSINIYLFWCKSERIIKITFKLSKVSIAHPTLQLPLRERSL